MAESPLTQAKAIVTPLMVVQGKNDPRVNVRESDQIVAAVRDNGKPVEYLVAPDEGHGFARPINNLAMVTAMEEFFAQYLGGRNQKDVPPDVAAKLKEITVDPKSVSGTVSLKGAWRRRAIERRHVGAAPVAVAARAGVAAHCIIDAGVVQSASPAAARSRRAAGHRGWLPSIAPRAGRCCAW